MADKEENEPSNEPAEIPTTVSSTLEASQKPDPRTTYTGVHKSSDDE